MRMNIYDIAREAGFSIGTVSRVLNNKTNVAPETRQKIERILQKYNYRPSAIARGLVTKTMHSIAILTVDVRVPNYARTVYTVEQEFSKLGYMVTVCNTGGCIDRARHYIQSLVEKQIAGLVFVGSIFNTLCKDKLIAANLAGIPSVCANGKLEHSNSFSILIDDMHGIECAFTHLWDQGHRKICYVKDLDTESAAIKAEGFIKASSSRGAHPGHIINVVYGFEGGIQAAREILSCEERPTAIVFGEDLTAVSAAKELQKAGLSIPEDIAITGYNNSDYSRLCSPELTTVDNKPEITASLCVMLLANMIEGRNQQASMTIEPELIIRASS